MRRVFLAWGAGLISVMSATTASAWICRAVSPVPWSERLEQKSTMRNDDYVVVSGKADAIRLSDEKIQIGRDNEWAHPLIVSFRVNRALLGIVADRIDIHLIPSLNDVQFFVTAEAMNGREFEIGLWPRRIVFNAYSPDECGHFWRSTNSNKSTAPDAEVNTR